MILNNPQSTGTKSHGILISGWMRRYPINLTYSQIDSFYLQCKDPEKVKQSKPQFERRCVPLGSSAWLM